MNRRARPPERALAWGVAIAVFTLVMGCRSTSPTERDRFESVLLREGCEGVVLKLPNTRGRGDEVSSPFRVRVEDGEWELESTTVELEVSRASDAHRYIRLELWDVDGDHIRSSDLATIHKTESSGTRTVHVPERYLGPGPSFTTSINLVSHSGSCNLLSVRVDGVPESR